MGDAVPSVLAERDHAFADGEVAEFGGGGAALDEFLEAGAHETNLEECGAARVSGVAAFITTDGTTDFVGPLDRKADFGQALGTVFSWLGAMRAKAADEALGDEGADGRADEEWLDAHVEEAGDAADGVIRVERAEDEVAGECGADGDLGGFQIAHFTDHDDIRVAAQDAAERGGEGEVDLGLHSDLDDTIEFVFHRVLDRHDATLFHIKAAEEGVERGAFAATSGAGDEDDAVRARDEIADALFVGRVEAEAGEIEALLAEEAEADIFAVDARDRGHADIDRLAGDLEGDAAVLRSAALGNVEAGHDFQAGDHGILEHFDPLRNGGLVEDAVDAVADAEVVAERFEVDVGRALVEALAEDLVHELHDRGFGVVFPDLVDFLLHAAGEVVLAAFEEFLESIGADAVGALERFEKAAPGGHDRANWAAPVLGDGLPRGVVKRVESKEPHFAALDGGLGNDQLAEREAGGKFLTHLLDGRDLAFLAPGDIEFGGEVFQEIGFADELRIKERGDGGALGERGAL